MVMKPVQFRFSEETLEQLRWLEGRLNLNRSEVARLAIARLYHEERAKESQARLVPEGDGWVLLSGGKEVARVGEDVLSRLPEEVRNGLREGMPEGEALGALLLAAAKAQEPTSSRDG